MHLLFNNSFSTFIPINTKYKNTDNDKLNI